MFGLLLKGLCLQEALSPWEAMLLEQGFQMLGGHRIGCSGHTCYMVLGRLGLFGNSKGKEWKSTLKKQGSLYTGWLSAE